MADAPVFRDGLLAGQVGIVTGGGTGIGFGIAELLASLGMHVVLASRRAEHIEPAAERTARRRRPGIRRDARRARSGARARGDRRRRASSTAGSTCS